MTLETESQAPPDSPPDNLFLNYLSRIHRDEDFQFILSGITRLLMNPLTQTYLPGSQKKAGFLIVCNKKAIVNISGSFSPRASDSVLEAV